MLRDMQRYARSSCRYALVTARVDVLLRRHAAGYFRRWNAQVNKNTQAAPRYERCAFIRAPPRYHAYAAAALCRYAFTRVPTPLMLP